uniref:Uncharacterized protein n=1 Tax=Oryza nivara TaxID=4536 RepID=A0A0E0IJS8_ORYNI
MSAIKDSCPRVAPRAGATRVATTTTAALPPRLLPFFASPPPERAAGNCVAARTAAAGPPFFPRGRGLEPTTPPRSGVPTASTELGEGLAPSGGGNGESGSVDGEAETTGTTGRDGVGKGDDSDAASPDLASPGQIRPPSSESGLPGAGGQLSSRLR